MAGDAPAGLSIRHAEAADAAAITAIYAPYVTDSAISFEAEAPDAAEIGRRMAAGGPLYPWLVAEWQGDVTGYAYASPFRARAAYRFVVETSVYVARDRQGHGAGGALMARLLASLEAQGFTQAVAAIALPNRGSVRLHERFGFIAVGEYRQVGWKRGQWHDVGLWQRPLAAPSDPPGEPRPYSAGSKRA